MISSALQGQQWISLVSVWQHHLSIRGCTQQANFDLPEQSQELPHHAQKGLKDANYSILNYP